MKIRLIAIGSMPREAWARRYARWVNDPEVTKFLYQGTTTTSIEECEKLYDTLTNSNNVVYNIMIAPKKNVKEEDDKAESLEYSDPSIGGLWVGIVGIFDIYWPSKVGEFRILIGNKTAWSRGIGKLCLNEMNRVAFDRLGLHKFWLGFNGNHKGAEKAYSKSGFQHECIIKQHHYKNGVYNDLVRMCMFRPDYEKWRKTLDTKA